MRFGMVREQVPARGDFANQFWTRASKASDDEERRARLVVIEQIKQTGRTWDSGRRRKSVQFPARRCDREDDRW